MCVARKRALVLLALGGLGCSGGGASGAATFPEAAFATMPTTSGALDVEVRTSPQQPPSQGVDAVQYVVTTKDGAPVDGLTLEVTPWMPEMGHGASLVPTVTASGHGVYLISEVEFFMPGTWVLRTSIAGSATDSVTPEFQIP